jgi:hypothetical protein
MQSFLRMRGMPPAFNPTQVSVLWLILNPHRYENFPARSPSMTKRCAAYRALPGVSAAAIASRIDVLQRADMDD